MAGVSEKYSGRVPWPYLQALDRGVGRIEQRDGRGLSSRGNDDALLAVRADQDRAVFRPAAFQDEWLGVRARQDVERLAGLESLGCMRERLPGAADARALVVVRAGRPNEEDVALIRERTDVRVARGLLAEGRISLEPDVILRRIAEPRRLHVLRPNDQIAR